VSVYIERQSDAQFTLFLAGLDARTVLAERHVRLRSVEKKILKFHQAAKPKPVATGPRFTERQMEIAIAAMAKRSIKTNAVQAAETSN
jgi:hypothetical protein